MGSSSQSFVGKTMLHIEERYCSIEGFNESQLGQQSTKTDLNWASCARTTGGDDFNQSRDRKTQTQVLLQWLNKESGDRYMFTRINPKCWCSKNLVFEDMNHLST